MRRILPWNPTQHQLGRARVTGLTQPDSSQAVSCPDDPPTEDALSLEKFKTLAGHSSLNRLSSSTSRRNSPNRWNLVGDVASSRSPCLGTLEALATAERRLRPGGRITDVSLPPVPPLSRFASSVPPRRLPELLEDASQLVRNTSHIRRVVGGHCCMNANIRQRFLRILRSTSRLHPELPEKPRDEPLSVGFGNRNIWWAVARTSGFGTLHFCLPQSIFETRLGIRLFVPQNL